MTVLYLALRSGLRSGLRFRLSDVFERRRGCRSGGEASGLRNLLLDGFALDMLEGCRRICVDDTDSRLLDLLLCELPDLVLLSCASLSLCRFRDRCGDDDGDGDVDDLVEMVETESDSDDIDLDRMK